MGDFIVCAVVLFHSLRMHKILRVFLVSVCIKFGRFEQCNVGNLYKFNLFLGFTLKRFTPRMSP